jgi:uncharacterized repeat protein (TIGR04076 family)
VDLEITVTRIEGQCPVYMRNDSFILEDGYRLVSEKPLCMHSLAAILPFYNALRFASPGELGLSETHNPEIVCVRCPDAEPCTGGGAVTFEIRKVRKI